MATSSVQSLKPRKAAVRFSAKQGWTAAGSMAVWVIAWLVGADLLITALRPLRYVQLNTIVLEDQDPLDLKVRALESANNKYDVLMLGSSLAAAVASAEPVLEPSLGAIPGMKMHTKAETFDRTLARQVGCSPTTINMGIDACMASEDQLLLEKAVATGHHLKIALLLIAPRDFISNSFNPKNGHLHRYFINRAPLWQRLSFKEDPLQNFNRIAEQSSIYKNRGYFARICEMVMCGYLHRTPNMWYAQRPTEYWKNFEQPKLLLSFKLPFRCGGRGPIQNSEKQKRTHEAEVERLMDYYRGDYLPVNYSRFSSEIEALNKTLQFAENNNIMPIVVNMPRGLNNDALLPEDFKLRYSREIQAVCARNKTRYYDFMGIPAFHDDSNFSDAVHLSPAGAHKFIEMLSERMSQDSVARRKLM
jgi:hypothetical protein